MASPVGAALDVGAAPTMAAPVSTAPPPPPPRQAVPTAADAPAVGGPYVPTPVPVATPLPAPAANPALVPMILALAGFVVLFGLVIAFLTVRCVASAVTEDADVLDQQPLASHAQLESDQSSRSTSSRS